jgi:hypothetical protein
MYAFYMHQLAHALSLSNSPRAINQSSMLQKTYPKRPLPTPNPNPPPLPKKPIPWVETEHDGGHLQPSQQFLNTESSPH